MTMFDLFSILNMLGGLALFLFGMHLMSDSLERAGGAKLSGILERLTHNMLSCVLCGFFVTAIIQSSSATTVMVVGFVNAGILTLDRAVGVIMGANIGTTVTSWILSLSGLQGDSFFVKLFKPSALGPILAIAGVVLFLFLHKAKQKNTGSALLGLGMIFIGMNIMSAAMSPLVEMPEVQNILTLFENPFVGVTVGALITALLQSSSASIGILQALSASGRINFGMAMPIILGQNIGTCVTAILASAGANRNAKRAAAIHLSFNLIGTGIFLAIYLLLRQFVTLPFLAGAITESGIAVIHTIFNVGSTLLLLPFSKALVKLSTFVIREKKSVAEEVYDLLDDRFLVNPAYALVQCNRTMATMADLSCENLKHSLALLTAYNEDEYGKVFENEETADHIEDRIGSYAVKLTDKTLSEDESKTVSKILHAVNDFERICDHSINLAEIAKHAHDAKIVFSPAAQIEISLMCDAVTEMLDMTKKVYLQGDVSLATRVEPLEEIIDLMDSTLKDRHVERLKDGKCGIETGVLFLDFLSNAERVSDHCSNIAIAVIELAKSRLDSHEYAKELHEKGGDEYNQVLAEYRDKYFVPIAG